MQLRPEVRIFAEAMERRLRANDHKGGWKHETVYAYLLPRLLEELGELAMLLSDAYLQTPKSERILQEAADVANFAMMIADVTGALGRGQS